MSEINQEQLYGRYMAQEDVSAAQANRKRDWRDRLDQKLRHKALNIPIDPDDEDDPLKVTNTTVRNGFDWKHLAVIAAAGLGGMGIYHFADKEVPQQTVPPTVRTAPEDVSQKFDVTIYQKNADGTFTPFTMPRLPEGAEIKQ
ncbi:MAG: hypothetical protein L0228_10775 [Planctomycetes bacterium]|nr:hypothetical protein [Planctomycetota bacterium]